MDLSENYQFNYQKLLKFLKRISHSGYTFVMADDYRFIAQINSSLLQDLEESKVSVKNIFLEVSAEEPLLAQIKNASDGYQSLIVSNLYEVIDTSEHGLNRLLQLNFSREELRQLHTPILFWVDAASLNVIANHAPDLFSQRRFTTVHFTGKVENPVSEVLEKPEWKEFISSEKFKEIEARIETLQRRLTDAEKSGYHPERIADEIALPLAKEYAELNLKDKARAVLTKYLGFVDQKEASHLRQLAKIYNTMHDYSLAIKTLQKANEILEAPKSAAESNYSADWFTNILDIADWMHECGRANEALELLQKSETLFRSALSHFSYEWGQDFLSLLLERTGILYQSMQQMEQAIAYFEKCLTIRRELVTKNPGSERLQLLLSSAYTFLGDSYDEFGNLRQAKYYFEESLRITEKLQLVKPTDEALKRDTFVCYNRLAGISVKMSNLTQAIAYYKKSLGIIKELERNSPYSSGFKRDLAVQYFKLGELEEQQGNSNDARNYFSTAYTILQELIKVNPDSKVLQGDIAEAEEKIRSLNLRKEKS